MIKSKNATKEALKLCISNAFGADKKGIFKDWVSPRLIAASFYPT